MVSSLVNLIPLDQKASDFEKLLGAREFPPYEQIMEDEGYLKKIASELYGDNPDAIGSVMASQVMTTQYKDKIYKVSEVEIACNGQKKAFYVKESWENSLRESLGLEIYNLLTDQPTLFLFDKSIIITDEVPGEKMSKKTTPIQDDPRYAKSYGKLEEFVSIIQLGDRYTRNVFITEGMDLRNIDFGYSFYYDYTLYIPRPFDEEEVKKGKEEGSKIIHENLEKNWQRIKAIAELVTEDIVAGINSKTYTAMVSTPKKALERYAASKGW